MGIKVITAAASPLTLAQLRLHLKLDTTLGVHEDDALIQGLLDSAVEYAQHYTGRSVGSQILELALDAFPVGAIELKQGPVTSITSVKYTDTASVVQTVDSANYTLDDYSFQNWVLPAYVYTWPTTLDAANVVKVRYVAGAATVPAAILAALKLMVGHWYQNREQGSKFEIKEIPLGVHALLNTQKVWAM